MAFIKLAQALIYFASIGFSWLPKVDTLPFGADSTLLWLVQVWNAVMVEIPYFQTVWDRVLWFILFLIGYKTLQYLRIIPK